MSVSLATVIDVAKIDYFDTEVYTDFYKKMPWLAYVPKDEKAVGKEFETPLSFAPPTARSATFADALTQSASAATKYGKFAQQVYKRDYQVMEFDHLTMDTLIPDKGAYLDVTRREFENAAISLGRSLGMAIYRGAIIGTTTTTMGTTITLVLPSETVNFEVGDVIQFFNAPSGGTPFGGAAARRTIVAIDRDGGTFTVDVDVAALMIMGTAYICKAGDYDLKVKGFFDYILPFGAPVTTLFGLNRAQDVKRLSGVKIDGRGKNPEEFLIDALTQLDREGADPDFIFCPHLFWSRMVKATGARVIYLKHDTAKIGFPAIEIVGPGKPVPLVADVACPPDKLAIAQLNTWKLRTVGKAPRIFDEDVKMLRTNGDSYQVRMGYYAELTCEMPGWNASVLIDPA